MNQNLITVLVRFLMRFGVFILVTTPLTSLHAQNSAKVQAEKAAKARSRRPRMRNKRRRGREGISI